MLVTWPIEMLSYSYTHNSIDSIIVSDFIKCFSAALVFCIFVLNQNVRSLMFDRYASLVNNQEILVPESP